MARRNRLQNGNLYILYVALAGFLIAAFYVAATFGLNSIFEMKVKNALEAASLQAASDLSKIVINDPHWGYVSLTDHPPIGKATIAQDEEPLPVTGINTILATARNELVLAHAIGTNEAINCAMEDVEAAKLAQRRLEYVLSQALSSDNPTCKDMHGQLVTPLKNAKKLFEQNTGKLAMTCGFKLDSLEADLGYLKSGSTTNCRLNGSIHTLGVDKNLVENNKLVAFKNIPFNQIDFYYAGLGNQASLVDAKDFEHMNGFQMCSIVRLKASMSKVSSKSKIKLNTRAAAQPFYKEDRTRPPIMALNFPHGLPSQLKSLKDLLTSRALSNKIALLTATGGDYPVDPGARLKPISSQKSSTVRYTITRGYLDWVRAAHNKPNLDSLISNLNTRFDTRFKQSPSKVHLYGFDNNGTLQVLKPAKIPFRKQTTYDQQLYTVAFNAISSDNMSWTFKVRDQTRNLGTISGGKHAGQPMPSINYIKELNQLQTIGNAQNRYTDKAGSRYDQSRLALEFEISSPQHISLSQANTF